MKKHLKTASLFTIIALFLMGATVGAEEGKPSGTIHIESKQFMLLLGGEKGEGTLHFNGNTYAFTTSGATAGGAGYQEVSASGKVYDLNKVGDFPGTYFAMRAGGSVGGGAGGQWLENDKGVRIHLSTTHKGLALGFGAEGLTIAMK